MQQIKLWAVKAESIQQVNRARLDYENRLEKWLLEDISVLSPNLVVIGSQVLTPYGKIIDILALNSLGELVIVELKRDKTYREVISQALDYATWVKELNYDDLNGILNKYGNSDIKDIGDLYSGAFNIDADEIDFNSDHKMLIVGSEIDDSTVRIINYLSNEPYSVNINAVNFNYFKDNEEKEFLAQSFIIPEENLIEVSRSKSRKRKKSIIRSLFDAGKLHIGDRVYLKPAIDAGTSKDNPKISAEIVNTGVNCLKRSDTPETFSFSRLRSVIGKELNLTAIPDGWGFGLEQDWITSDDRNLAELMND